ncbi:hypothetical protein HanPI659440_Chr15g0578561 [Helianthus annuus]|nr:hypothetical protein HanPI659440_Chr15g0578561 [Helianthus annuus]
MAREKDDYMKYYVPKVVSIGPYHFGNSNLQYAETLKPRLTMRLLKDNKETLRRLFDNLSEPETVQHLRCFYEENSTANFCDMEFRDADDDEKPTHLLAVVRGKLTKIVKTPKPVVNPFKYDAWNFRNVSELVDVGISFKASEQTTSLTHVDFVKNWWGFSANVKIPPITLYDETRQLLLNMIAYETYCCSIYDAWVTSYYSHYTTFAITPHADWDDTCRIMPRGGGIIFSTTTHGLRKGWVIHNHLSSDKEVATLFEEIAIDLFPNSLAYYEAMNKIQTHYESLSNTLFSQLKNECFKSPWAIFALLGALIALFLAGVQTYFTVWSPESKCDDLCVFLKMNHHL